MNHAKGRELEVCLTEADSPKGMYSLLPWKQTAVVGQYTLLNLSKCWYLSSCLLLFRCVCIQIHMWSCICVFIYGKREGMQYMSIRIVHI